MHDAVLIDPNHKLVPPDVSQKIDEPEMTHMLVTEGEAVREWRALARGCLRNVIARDILGWVKEIGDVNEDDVHRRRASL
jgi:hypothetical protein